MPLGGPSNTRNATAWAKACSRSVPSIPVRSCSGWADLLKLEIEQIRGGRADRVLRGWVQPLRADPSLRWSAGHQQAVSHAPSSPRLRSSADTSVGSARSVTIRAACARLYRSL